MLRRLLRRVPGARSLRRSWDRLRTPPALRGEVDLLRGTVRRLDDELSEVRHVALTGGEGPLVMDGHLRSVANEQATPTQPSRVLCSLGVGPHAELLRISSQTFHAYAWQYGYDLLLTTRWLVPERPPAWSKIALVRRLLDQYELVLWVDADAAFVDLSTDIADLVRPGKDLYLVEHTWEGGQRRSANFGVFLICATDWSRKLLDDTWAAEQYIDHRWWENAALLDMLGYELPADGSRPRKARTTELEERVEFIGLEWNSNTVDLAVPNPRVHHHGRGPSLRSLLEADVIACRANLRAGS